ncbi:MAG: ABC transporter substrate-binding protein [Acidimicrobiales bacterium]
MKNRRARLIAALALAGLVVAACGSSGNKTASSSSGNATSDGSSGAFSVDTASCPPEATAKIDSTVKIGATMPLSGGTAAIAFAPVKAGFESYIKYANEQNLLPGHPIELTIEDDQYNASLTTPAVAKLLDDTKVDIIDGIIGSPNNSAVRDTLNGDCVPQINALSGLPAWGDVAKYPWTTGGLYSYNSEARVYLDRIKADFPQGAKVAIFRVNSDFGQAYEDAYRKYGPDANVTIIDDQTVEAADSAPPTPQVTSIASKSPDVILASPLGAGCISFLKELANAKAANPGFNPTLYLGGTCASPLILGVAGESAEGLQTVTPGKDAADPKNATDPAVKLLIDRLTADGFTGDIATAATGWNTGEATVKALIAAAASPDGLSRASILNAARQLSYHPPLFRDGIDWKMDGTKDPFAVESLQVVKFSAATKTYTDIGPVVDQFEGKTSLN